MPKKLIEVALPLDAINKESSREKSIRFGHPSTLHLWWARRPLAAARAVIWASVIDDPSEHPELFPTEKEQLEERRRLFSILEKLVVWENANDETILNEAKSEMKKYTDTETIEFLDPFSGGGTIPLEAQRLGLRVHAHDLNPVAVMINKATVEIPAKFSDRHPVNPDSNRIDLSGTCKGTYGLVEDVKYYGEWLKNRVNEKIGHLYPKVALEGEKEKNANVVAWVWCRTVKCPNPGCGCTMPLVSTFMLSKKKGKEAWIEPYYDGDSLKFHVHKGKCPGEKETNKTGRSAVFRCLKCGEVTTDEYVKEQGKTKGLGKKMMAIIAEGKRGREFLEIDCEQEMAANVSKPENFPDGTISTNPRWFSPPAFGMTEYCDLFSERQLTLLVTLSDTISEVQSQVIKDAVAAGIEDDYIHIDDGGDGATAYSEAIAVYLAFAIDRQANYSSTLNGWSGDFIIQTFGRQALPMVWDYAETNPFSDSTGNWSGAVNWISLALERFPAAGEAEARQFDAQKDTGLRNLLISTDPPYYDNIGYADLSDYFYIWLRRTLKDIYPKVFRTILVPKADELVAIPFRFEGNSQKAKNFFEDGMYQACKQLRENAKEDYPVTIYYAFKQSETKQTDTGSQTASTGWETMLTAIVNAGFSITGTWPMHTERETGFKAAVNALASSIVLVCRKRPLDSKVCTRRNFINELKRELRPALRNLQESNIAPVDLAQSAIGPGMSVYSRYNKVLEADGTPMSVRSALQTINEEIDLFFNEQVGELDADSRFAVQLYMQCAFNEIKFGEAEVLANAKGASIPLMVSRSMLYAKAGVVHLYDRDKLPEKVDSSENNIWMLTQQLTRAMEKGGVEACANIVLSMFGSNAERAKDLAYRLYTIAEQKKWANEAYVYNSLVVAWPDIQSRAAALKAIEPKQMTLFDLQ